MTLPARQRRVACIWRRDGGRQRFEVPFHYRIYVDGDALVIGCHRTGCEAWRAARDTILTVTTEVERQWLI